MKSLIESYEKKIEEEETNKINFEKLNQDLIIRNQHLTEQSHEENQKSMQFYDIVKENILKAYDILGDSKVDLSTSEKLM